MSRAHLVFATAFLMTAAVLFDPVLATATPKGPIKTVFVILMENHDWSEIQGNSLAPFTPGCVLIRPPKQWLLRKRSAEFIPPVVKSARRKRNEFHAPGGSVEMRPSLPQR